MENGYKKCTYCAEEIKADANICRFCHKNQNENEAFINSKDVLIMFVIVVLAFIGYKYITAYKPSANEKRIEQYKPVVEDYIQQYNIAVKQGDKMQIAAQASIVATAYLVAHDEVNYKKWKQIEKEAQNNYIRSEMNSIK